MQNSLGQIFFNAVFGEVQHQVTKRNKESGVHLTLERTYNGLRVTRKSPFLAVERWLDDGGHIHGRAECAGSRRSTMATLTVTGEDEASLPEDPLTPMPKLTTSDVAGGVLASFDRP